MQDLCSVPGGTTGRLFVGGTVGVGSGPAAGGAAAAVVALDRRLRPHPQQNLRCPRCDSFNTKFCYYNNYNLSQPRHFCKSCRRYWTKGGVLRNVPVGGGCRKSKRSSSSSSSKPSKSSTICKDHRHVSSTAAASSSDSSTLTANGPDASTVTQEPSTPPPPSTLDSYTTALLDSIHEVGTPPTPAGVFPETGSFTSLITAVPNPDVGGLNFTSSPQLHLLPVQQLKATPPQARMGMMEEEICMPGMTLPERYVDQIAHMDMLPLPTQGMTAVGPTLATVDWLGGVDMPAGLFDAAAASVAGDHGGYWNQSQWGEIDPSLFLP